ncbi:MAG: sulfur carrier protein ThiS [Gemmatimonadota bacterium]|nr:sulfur carrier protein ThiS [Gemmatimonadota bacterium]MDH4349713.1 sulfur carrier protein ThiS [Gemmatimonadota bacterium]MDH5197083.1 sulfur carrier protein ThiS [Gemmatimonadota bacterium]
MTTGPIQFTLNGEPRELPDGLTLLQLLEHFALDPRAVVVERNREIVRRPALAETPLKAGDTIELVHFVGGG